ncbi:hypothetical protein DERF_004685 [Dermatophagoides farinae]|uniref:Uncharacterized protein n=1 Tax=Dermatophagoides farinae TaxID=6954 RepID=A0A922I5B3_DERFA|nr:hypothetical protein DERF_004685 [Dermatophagoides farinae]
MNSPQSGGDTDIVNDCHCCEQPLDGCLGTSTRRSLAPRNPFHNEFRSCPRCIHTARMIVDLDRHRTTICNLRFGKQ